MPLPWGNYSQESTSKAFPERLSYLATNELSFQAISYSASRKGPRSAHIQSIYTSTYGILFFGTPHHGSSKARLLGNLQRIAQLAIPKKAADFETGLVNALEEQSEILQNITDQFTPLMNEFRIYFFWEEE